MIRPAQQAFGKARDRLRLVTLRLKWGSKLEIHRKFSSAQNGSSACAPQHYRPPEEAPPVGNHGPALIESGLLKLTAPRSPGIFVIVAGCLLGGCRAPAPSLSPAPPRYTLQTSGVWQLNLPEGQRFDASGLLLTPQGELLTVSDRGPSIYRIEFSTNAAAADLARLPDCFTEAQLAPFAAEKHDRYDCEGMAQDSAGRLYLCEEADRWILRFDPVTHRVTRLEIDWTPVRKYFDPFDHDASFEGIAIDNETLYVANERQRGRLIAVDLQTLKVIDDFVVRPRRGGFVDLLTGGDVHYSDLCWRDGSLYALLRENRVILKIDPAKHQVLAEYDYGAVENAPDVLYHRIYPFVGVMEGLAVDRDCFWLVTDNNGLGRVRRPEDTRPTLFRCPRPDAAPSRAGVTSRVSDSGR